jgi:hypothetical protein
MCERSGTVLGTLETGRLKPISWRSRALNWATREKDASGKWLLQENPLRGVELPKEKNPRRPVVTEAEFQRLLEVAPRFTRS